MTRHKGVVIYSIKKTFSFKEDQQEKMWRLSEKLGMSESELARLAFDNLYEKEFGDGK